MRRTLLVLLLLFGTSAQAQVNDDALEAALVHWRAASWYMRIGNTDVATLEIESFRDKWPAAGIDEPSIAALAETASVALDTNDPVTAARSLAAIGDTLAELRRQAGQTGLPEAMRAYRGTVERLAGMISMSEQRAGAPFDDALRAQVRAAATDALTAAARLPPLTPARWAGEAKFRELLQQNIDGLRNLLVSIDRPSPRGIGLDGLEIAGLIAIARANYNLMFLNYGY